MTETYEHCVARRLAQEHAEFDDPVVKQQLLLDRWVESERALAAELGDFHMVGGYLERHSLTPSFHRSPRDRDWR